MAQDDPKEQGSVEPESSAAGQTPSDDVKHPQAVSDTPNDRPLPPSVTEPVEVACPFDLDTASNRRVLESTSVPVQRGAAASVRPASLSVLDQAAAGSLSRVLRDGALGRIGALSAGQNAAGKIGALASGSRATSGVSSFLERDTSALAALNKGLGGSIGQGVADRFLADQGDRDRRLAGLAGFTGRAALDAWAKPLGGIDVARWAQLNTIGGNLSSIDRGARWARGIGGGSLADLASAQVPRGLLADQIGAVSRAADTALGRLAGFNPSLTSNLDTLLKRHHDFAPTVRKLSLFAGALDVVGPGVATNAAFEALLGGWHSRNDLPAEFWRRPEQRTRFYREADVDAGLIDADNAELVEMLIETGVVDGDVRNGRATAVVEAGPIKVRVSAARPRQGAARVLAAFELGMRGFVEMKLRAAMEAAGENPDKWFNQRMPGDIVKRARERRAAARLAGEPPSPPIAFVDLGDFIDIITQGKNWPVFEPVFGSLEGFRVDLGRLNALRRPIAHVRAIDPVQLAETTLTVARLTRSITLDGGWDAAWDDNG